MKGACCITTAALLLFVGICGIEKTSYAGETVTDGQVSSAAGGPASSWMTQMRIFPGEGPELAEEAILPGEVHNIEMKGPDEDKERSESVIHIVPDEYATITEAVAIAGNGDTIIVYADDFNYDDSIETFPITITQDDLTLYSPDHATVISTNPDKNIFLIGTYTPTFTGVSGVTIDGFEIVTSRNGILAMATANDPTDYLTIRNCSLEYIGPEEAERCMFGTYCYLQLGADYSNLLIENVEIPYCERGICLLSAGYGVYDNASIRESEIHALTDGIVVIGQNGVDFLPATTGVDISGNLITRKHFRPVPGSWGVGLFSVSESLVQANIIQEYEYGLQLGAPNSRASVLDDNKFHKNKISIGLYGSDENLIIDNNFSKDYLADVDISNVCPYDQCYNAPEDLPAKDNSFVSNSPWKADYLKGNLVVDNWEDGVLVEPPVVNAGNLFLQGDSRHDRGKRPFQPRLRLP